jgi:hypothetical protein
MSQAVGTEIVFPDKYPPLGHWEGREDVTPVQKMLLLTCTIFNFACTGTIFVIIGTAAVSTAVVPIIIGIILSLPILLILLISLNILVIGVLIRIPTSVRSSSRCDSGLLRRLTAAAAVWLCGADWHLVRTAASIFVSTLVLPVNKFTAGSTSSGILCIAAAAAAHS